MKDQFERERRAMSSVCRGKTAAGKSLAAFKERKEKKFKEKAMLIRQYKKAIKSVGCETSKAPSVEENKSQTPPEQQISSQSSKRRQRLDPFLKAKKLAEENQRTKTASRVRAAERTALIKKREADRKRRAVMLSKKTRKGQPIMNNIAKDLLEKLQKEKEIDMGGDK